MDYHKINSFGVGTPENYSPFSGREPLAFDDFETPLKKPKA
jgi:hypothetical protein